MIRSLYLLVTALLRFAHPNTQKMTAFRPGKFIIVAAALLFSSFSFSSDYSWNGYSSVPAACTAWIAGLPPSSLTYRPAGAIVRTSTDAQCYADQVTSTGQNLGQISIWVSRSGDSCPTSTTYNAITGACDAPPPCLGDSVRDSDGMCVLTCAAGQRANSTTMICESLCPTGKHWDFETSSCKYPEDDGCPTGSDWTPEANSCVCAGNAILSNTIGFRVCMPKVSGECTPDSPDFVGMVNGYKPFCSGKARCPEGSRLGTIAKNGGSDQSVCIPDQGDDPKCPGGTAGNFNGDAVCIPKPNEDPDCPSGQSGMVNGVKKCIPKPGDPGACKAGETPGFVGSGSSANAVCIPSSYKPETCPPGQYVYNVNGGGFGCAKLAPSQKPPTKDDPLTTDVDESKKAQQGSSKGTTKDANGNVTGTQDFEIKFPEDGLEIKGLLEDQPKTDFFKDSNSFSDSELEKLDEPQKDFLSDVTRGDGSFTERGKLNQATGLISNLFGNGSGCSGQLVLGQYKGHSFAASCEKLSKMKDLFAWFIYITTVMGIYNVLMRPPVS